MNPLAFRRLPGGWQLRVTLDEWSVLWAARLPRIPGLYAWGADVLVYQFGPLAVFRDLRPGERG